MKILKLRIYDSKIKQLEKLASSVNFVWNYVNELSYKYLRVQANSYLPMI